MSCHAFDYFAPDRNPQRFHIRLLKAHRKLTDAMTELAEMQEFASGAPADTWHGQVELYLQYASTHARQARQWLDRTHSLYDIPAAAHEKSIWDALLDEPTYLDPYDDDLPEPEEAE